MNIRYALIAIVGLAVGGLGALALLPSQQKDANGTQSASMGKAQVGGPFTLVDGSGKAVTDASFRGRYMLVYFGYTYCPDVCPAGLQVIAAALDKLGPKADKVAPIFISLDPARDTPAKMADYVGSFSPRLIGLTGSEEQVAAAAKAYRVYSRKVVDTKSPNDYTLDHSSIIYVMDPKGEFVMHFTHATSADMIADRLGKLL